jgi:predicted NBD/HSP70 family sugar kinase
VLPLGTLYTPLRPVAELPVVPYDTVRTATGGFQTGQDGATRFFRQRKYITLGDPVALAAFNTTAHFLGAGIASLCVILDPTRVVIGGGVVEAGEILLAPTRESMTRHMPFAGKHPYPDIVPAELGNEAGLVGVADLARL